MIPKNVQSVFLTEQIHSKSFCQNNKPKEIEKQFSDFQIQAKKLDQNNYILLNDSQTWETKIINLKKTLCKPVIEANEHLENLKSELKKENIDEEKLIIRQIKLVVFWNAGRTNSKKKFSLEF